MADSKSVPNRGDKERGRYQLPDDSGSESESGAETDDEASSTSDYPLQLGQPGMATTAASKDTTSQEHRCAASVEKTVAGQHQDVPHKEESPLHEVRGTSSPLPTAQLPELDLCEDRDSGGNEPDVSCSGSELEGGGGGNIFSQDQSEPQLLQLPVSRLLTAKHDNDHSGESGSESSSVESVEDELGLEDLSLQNKLHRPHRDMTGDGGQQIDSLSVASTTLTSTTNSYLYGENASDRVRHLVKRSISKKKKQLQRQSRPKETKGPTPAGRRSKKMNRSAVKHVSIY